MSTTTVVVDKLEAKHTEEVIQYIFRLAKNTAFSSLSETISAVAAGVYLLSSGVPSGSHLSSMVTATDYSNNTTEDGYYASVTINGGTNAYSYRVFLEITCTSNHKYIVAGDFKVVNLGETSIP